MGPYMRKVLILLGSHSDIPSTGQGQDLLRSFRIPYELRIASVHQAPAFAAEVVKSFEAQGGRVILAGTVAPGVVASLTNLPVLAIPALSPVRAGLEASLSQMPTDIPIATMPPGAAGFTQAALFACQILAAGDDELSKELGFYRQSQSAQVFEADAAHRVTYDV